MERYIWVIVFVGMAVIIELGFLHSYFLDGELIKKKQLSKKNLLVNSSLVGLSIVCILLAVYLYFDIQSQLKLLESL